METYTLGYKFRIYPNATQARLIHRTPGQFLDTYHVFSARYIKNLHQSAPNQAGRAGISCAARFWEPLTA